MIRMTQAAPIALSLGLMLAAPALGAEGKAGHKHGDSGHMAGMEALEAKLSETAAFGAKGEPAKASRTIEIEASEIQFNLEAIEIKVGETVRFVVSNKGEQAHELTIGDEPYQQVAREMMTHMAEMGMDLASPEHAAMHAPAGNTVIVPVGETREIVWTFTKPGTFEFSCNMPGHSEVGMKGVIKVS